MVKSMTVHIGDLLSPGATGVIICCGERLDGSVFVGHSLTEKYFDEAGGENTLFLNLCKSSTETFFDEKRQFLNVTVSPFGDFKHYSHALKYGHEIKPEIINVTHLEELQPEELCLLSTVSEDIQCIANSNCTNIDEFISKLCESFGDEKLIDLVRFLSNTKALLHTTRTYQAYGHKHVAVMFTRELHNKLQAQENITDVKNVLLKYAVHAMAPLATDFSSSHLHVPAA